MLWPTPPSPLGPTPLPPAVLFITREMNDLSSSTTSFTSRSSGDTAGAAAAVLEGALPALRGAVSRSALAAPAPEPDEVDEEEAWGVLEPLADAVVVSPVTRHCCNTKAPSQ